MHQKVSNPYKVFSIITILVAGFCFWMNFSEFFTVGILKQTGGYPFGNEGPAPWYYKTATSYSTYCLAWSVLFLALLIVGFWTVIKSKKIVAIKNFGLMNLAIALEFITSVIDSSV